MKIQSVSATPFFKARNNKSLLKEQQVTCSIQPNCNLINKTSLYSLPYYINFGKTNDINETKASSYLEKIKEEKMTVSEVKNFLNKVINSDEERENFFDELTSNPAKSQENIEFLQKKLGGIENFTTWYLSENGYLENYEKYLNKKYEKAESIDELLKIQPNWGYWAFERKQASIENPHTNVDILMRDRKINFVFGSIPKDFGNKSDFNFLCKFLKNSEYGIKDESICIDGRIFTINQLSGGDKSAKNIYKLETLGGKNYIIKMDRFYPEDKLLAQENAYISRIAKETKMLRGDSVYLDACIDRYLDLNGINSNAKLLYYDFENNTSIYEYIDCEEIELNGEKKSIEQIEANQLFKDINAVGIFLNDIGLTYNCYKDKTGKYRVIDVGHAEFIDLLKPGAKLLTIETSNLCGFSYKNFLSGLNIKGLNSLNKPISKLPLNLFDKIPYEKFVKEKNIIKQNIKNNIGLISYYYGENNSNMFSERCSLIEFYIKDILARKTGYAENNPDIINGIINAINREINCIEKYDVEGKFKEKCQRYKEFISSDKEEEM